MRGLGRTELDNAAAQPGATSGREVEFVINCFERNYREVTQPGWLTRAARQHRFPFARRTLLVNNVDDRRDALKAAEGALARGEIDRYVFVDEHLDQALERTGLRRSDFGRYLHWSDCCVVALKLDGPDYLCYADVDLHLRGDGSWVHDALAVFDGDHRVGVANPNWRMRDGSTSIAWEADESGPGWYKGYGFSDQVFLLPRSKFSGPLLRRTVPLFVASPASARYPGVQLPFGRSSLFFEQIVDAYMRRSKLLRLTITSCEFEPIPVASYSDVDKVEQVARALGRRWMTAMDWAHRRAPGVLTSPRIRLVNGHVSQSAEARPTAAGATGSSREGRSSAAR